jgi:hypothetical protein
VSSTVIHNVRRDMFVSSSGPRQRPATGSAAEICRSMSSCSWCSTCRKRSAVRDLVVILRLHRLAPRLEVDRLARQFVGDVVGELVEALRVFGDERDALVAQLRQLGVVLAVNGPERLVFRLGELHHLGEDHHLLHADVAAQQLGIGAEVEHLRLLLLLWLRARLREHEQRGEKMSGHGGVPYFCFGG